MGTFRRPPAGTPHRYLIAHEDEARQYAELKTGLAERYRYNMEIAWKSKAGRKYQVEQGPDLQDGPWEAASPEVIATGATCFWSDVAEPGARVFYRVKEFE